MQPESGNVTVLGKLLVILIKSLILYGDDALRCSVDLIGFIGLSYCTNHPGDGFGLDGRNSRR
jgi:hypothetical protein